MPKTAYLWDIDGTLLLSGGAGKQAVLNTFKEVLGVEDAWGNLNPDGKTDDAIFDELHRTLFNKPLPIDVRNRIFDLYHTHLERELPLSADFRLMPSVVDVLTRLSNDPDASLGLATGNYEKAAFLKLARGGLDHFFSYGGFGTDSKVRQELTQKALERAIHAMGKKPDQVFLIGDTIHDVSCGIGIGAKVIAVTTGSTPASDLEHAGAYAVLDDLKDLFEVIKD